MGTLGKPSSPTPEAEISAVDKCLCDETDEGGSDRALGSRLAGTDIESRVGDRTGVPDDLDVERYRMLLLTMKGIFSL